MDELEPVRHVPDSERRARLGMRQALATEAQVHTPLQVATAVVAIPATEPATVHLACRARTNADLDLRVVEAALYDRRTVIKQLAMRRTLFVVGRDLLPALWGGPCLRTAAALGATLERDLELFNVAVNGKEWLATAREAVVERLKTGIELTSIQVSAEVPEASGSYQYGIGTQWEKRVSVTPRVLSQLNLEARIARAHTEGDWRGGSPLWTNYSVWLREDPFLLSAAEGYAELTTRWLRSYGPGTSDDLQWWLGATKAATEKALADAGGVPVSMEGGQLGWLHESDLEPVETPEHWAALLPALDPTPMGWLDRRFFAGETLDQLYDGDGQAGATAWVDGRAVGSWVQDEGGVVQIRLAEDLGIAERFALEQEAIKLTEWLQGDRLLSGGSES